MSAAPVLTMVAVVVAVVTVPRRRVGRRVHDAGRGVVGSIPWVDERLDRAGLAADSRTGLRVWGMAVAVGVGTGLLVGGSTGAVVGALVVAVGLPAWVVGRGDRRHAAVVAGLPELLELWARSLRGGADLHRALHDVADPASATAATLLPVIERIEAGARLGEALDGWVAELGHPDAAIVRAVLRLGDATGVATASALERAAATLRDRASMRAELAALTAQTRVSALVISLAPLGFLGVVGVADPDTARVLFTTGWGRLCLAAGLTLDGIGVVWMQRITTRVAA